MAFDITGVVLAGGESRRMGIDKSMMLFQKQKMIEYSLNAVKPFCKDILISSGKEIHQNFPYKRIEDHYQKIGPIAGIHSALKASKTDYILILPCDSPMVNEDFLKHLVSKIDGKCQSVVPQYLSHLEPLFAIYHSSILPIIEQQIEKEDYKLINLLKLIDTKIEVVSDNSSFVNINTPEDYKKYS